MQDFTRYDYTVTPEDLKRISSEWDGPIVVIINGEYYNLVSSKDTQTTEQGRDASLPF